MGKLNEIQKQMTQSYGDNAFTTTIKDDTVEFDSLKDKFTFKDEVEVPSLKVNGQPITPAEPQQQADWNQEDNTKADYIKNRICSEKQLGDRTYSINDDDKETLEANDAVLAYYYSIPDITIDFVNSFVGRTLKFGNIYNTQEGKINTNYTTVWTMYQITDWGTGENLPLYGITGYGDYDNLFICLENGVSYSDYTLNKGLYIITETGNSGDITYEISNSDLSKIDNKFIPEQKLQIKYGPITPGYYCIADSSNREMFNSDNEIIIDRGKVYSGVSDVFQIQGTIFFNNQALGFDYNFGGTIRTNVSGTLNGTYQFSGYLYYSDSDYEPIADIIFTKIS